MLAEGCSGPADVDGNVAEIRWQADSKASAPRVVTEDDIPVGAWEVVSSFHRGIGVDSERVFVFAGDKLPMLTGDDDKRVPFRFRCDSHPAEFDADDVDSARESVTFRGIWDRDGDELRLCFVFEGQARPRDFKCTVDDETTLLILRRCAVPPATAGSAP
ncbi:MAG: hypothetical protein HYS13_24290 [Planctomycetia bacterium]|nr:hypothetical protein [Planctomycetia bacterium]